MSWVTELREQFPVCRKTVFFDIAYENGGPDYLIGAATLFLDHWSDVSPTIVKAGGAGKGEIVKVVAETRSQVAELLGGVDPKGVAFTKNTNEGISMILQGFPWKPGDNIVTDDQEHSSVLIPCLNMERQGVQCRVAVSPDNLSVTPDLLWEHVDDRTKMIVVSHVQSCSGYRTDIEELACRTRERGIYLVVDAIQSLGFSPFDAKAWGVDAVASACYKGMLGIEGVGILYCDRDLLGKVWPVFAAANASVTVDRSEDPWKVVTKDPYDARKLENSTLNFLGIYVLREGLTRILDIGVDKIEKHIAGLVTRLHDGLTDLGYNVATPKDENHRCHSLSISIAETEKAYRFFQDRGVFLSLSAGRFVRMSVAPFTTDEDLGYALKVAEDCPFR